MKSKDACHERYRTQSDQMGVTDSVCANEEWNTSLLHRLTKAECSEELGLVSDTALGRVDRLARRHYDILDPRSKQGIFVDRKRQARSRKNRTHLLSRVIPLYKNVIGAQKHPRDVSARN